MFHAQQLLPQVMLPFVYDVSMSLKKAQQHVAHNCSPMYNGPLYIFGDLADEVILEFELISEVDLGQFLMDIRHNAVYTYQNMRMSDDFTKLRVTAHFLEQLKF